MLSSVAGVPYYDFCSGCGYEDGVEEKREERSQWHEHNWN